MKRVSLRIPRLVIVVVLGITVLVLLGSWTRVAAGATVLPTFSSLLGLERIGGGLDLSSGLTDQRHGPSVAYNGVDNEYMVVWLDSRNEDTTGNDIYGQRVSATGALLGDNIPIAVFEGSQAGPVVTHNSVGNQYLVAWQTQFGGPGSPDFNDAYGRRVSPGGALVGDAFRISDAGKEISMAYSPGANEYLATGRSFGSGPIDGILGQRVSASGASVGSEIQIATSGHPAPNGQVAYNPHRNEYIALWRSQAARNLQGQRIAASGALVGDPIVISSAFPEGLGGWCASVAFDPARDRYLVVFGVYYAMEIRGQFVSGSGELIGANFVIAANLPYRAVPYVAHSDSHSAFVVVWREYADVYGQLLSQNGVAIGDPLPIVRDTALWDPALVYNSTSGQFLVVWSDKRDLEQGVAEIYGQLIGIAGTVSAPIDIKPGSDPNSINCRNLTQVIPVALLTDDGFDALAVDHTKVTFDGASETHVNRRSGEPRRHEKDVDGDGDVDLVFHFRLGDTDLTCDSTEGVLSGETFGGVSIEGSDAVWMVARGRARP